LIETALHQPKAVWKCRHNSIRL